MASRLANVTFDCADAEALAGFWSQVLERPVDEGASPFFATIGLAADAPTFMFIQVPDPTPGKNRVHVDLSTEHPAAEVERLVALGAHHEGFHDEWGVKWTVLSDPAGNLFCVTGGH